MANASISVTTNVTVRDVDLRFEPYEFLTVQPALYIILVTILIIASVVGTCGNVLILVAIGTQRNLQNVESIFVVNLACCDLYVTLIADPMSIVGKTLGWRFFSDVPVLCRVVAYFCTISCVGSLMTLAAMSCNRYILICHRHLYRRIFTIRNSVTMCCFFYLLGFILIAFNFVGIGDHSFDHKSLECIWDRMADHSYTIVFAVVMVLIPITVIGLSYIRLYMYVRQSRLKVHNHGNNSNQKSEASVSATQPPACFDELELSKSANDGTAICDLARKESNKENDEQPEVQPQESDLQRKQNLLKTLRFDASGPLTEMRPNTLQGENRSSQKSPYDCDKDDRPSQSVSVRQPNKSSRSGGGSSTSTLKLARALFIIYLVFSACWLPFSLLIVLDADDTFSHDLHVTIVAWAHLHPSINWLVYYLTHQKFYTAFRKLLGMDRCCT